MRTPSLLSAAALAAFLSGCAAAPSRVAAAPEASAPPSAVAPSVVSADVVGAAPSAPPPMPGQAAPVTSAPSAPAAKTASADKTPAPRSDVTNPDLFILYTGDLSLSVEDGQVAPTIDQIIDAAIAAGGHIGSRKDASVSVVVPSSAFRQTFSVIEHLGEVTHRSIAAEDASEEYHDAEVRLQNLKATRKRIEEFLSRASGMSDMLTVERELERVVTEIDRIEGRMRFLREHTAFSTLTVNLQARPRPATVVAATPPAEPRHTPPRAIDLPAKWLGEIGYSRLLSGK
jgi:hypothetical protein